MHAILRGKESKRKRFSGVSNQKVHFRTTGNVARMHKSRVRKCLMRPWISEPRVICDQEMAYGRSLRVTWPTDLRAAFTEWASLAQDRVGWHKLVTESPF